MNIVAEQWERIEKPSENAEMDMLAVVNDMDKSVIEQILLHVPTGKLYRKRYWFKSSVMSAGEVWFKFVS